MSKPIVNAARGEVLATIAGRELTLCLTLEQMAQLEAALKTATFGDLLQRLAALSPADLPDVLAIMSRGAITAEEANAFTIGDIVRVRVALEALVTASFEEPTDEKKSAASRSKKFPGADGSASASA